LRLRFTNKRRRIPFGRLIAAIGSFPLDILQK
jgi:hypothetical protein